MRLLGMTLEIRLVTSAPNYLFESGDKPSLPLFQVPLIEATAHSIEGYGRLVEDPSACEIEIVSWPAQGWRPVDEGTGDERGQQFGATTQDRGHREQQPGTPVGPQIAGHSSQRCRARGAGGTDSSSYR